MERRLPAIFAADVVGYSKMWVRTPLWDGLWMLNALWLAPLVWWLGRGHHDPLDSPINSFYLVITACFWIGHRLSSAYLAYCTAAYRPLLHSQRTRFVWVPMGIAAFVFAFLVPGDDVYSLSRVERIVALAIVDYALVTYHFASQHYGVLSLYRIRSDRPRDGRARRIDRLFALGIGGVMIFVAELLAGAAVLQDRWFDPIVDPEWLSSVHGHFQVLGTGIVVLATGGLLWAEIRTGAPSLPRAAYVVSVSLMVVTAFFVDPFVFIVMWTAQHWLVAVGLTAVLAAGEPEPGPSRWYRFWNAVNRRRWSVLLVLGLISVTLMPVMEVEAVDDETARYGPQVFPFLTDLLAAPGMVPALIALGFASAFIHYAMDRSVFRFSDPEVRHAARGLLSPGR
ncbi:MAG: hypothetical protein ACR2PM_07695 [Hyphomicrobiales bacterium]